MLLALSAPLYPAPGGFSFVEDFQTQNLLDHQRTTARWTTAGMTIGHARHRHATNFWTLRARLGPSSDTAVLIDDIGLQDMDGDGRLDVITASNDTGIAIYFIGEIGSLSSAHAVAALAAIRPATVTEKRTRSMAFGDFDRDGDMDIIGAARGTGVRLYKNTGSGVFSDTSGIVRVSSLRPVDVVADDMDGDGDLDIVVTAKGASGRVHVYLNDGGGNFSLHHRLPVATYTMNRALAVGDLNGDGHLDIVLGKYRAADVFYLNDGSGGFGNAQTLRYTGKHPLTKGVALGDVDGDGDLDIAAGARRGKSLLYLNDGAGRFAEGRVIGRGAVFDVDLADVDGDGDLDLVEGRKHNSYVYRNNGGGVFDADGSYIGMRSRAVAVGDVDGDGDPDMVLGEKPASLEVVSLEGWSGRPEDAAGGVSYDKWKDKVTSRKVNGDAPVPPLVRLTATAEQPLHTEVVYLLSNNGGALWHRTYPGEPLRFPTSGNDLRWRVKLKTRLPSLSPLLTRIGIESIAEEPQITLSAPAPVAEGGVISFTVSIDAAATTSSDVVSVAWKINKNGDTPIAPNDFLETEGHSMRVFPAGTAVIPVGAREVTVTVPTFDDLRVETTETYAIVLSDPVGAELAATFSRLGTIGMSDFDQLPLRPVNIPAAPAAVDEGEDIRFTVAIDTHLMSCSVCHLYGGGDFSVAINRNRTPPDGTIAAAWRISGSGDNPANPSDFADLEGEPMTEFPGGVAIIPNDRREVTITVPTFDDDVDEGAKTYTVTLSNPGLSARLGGPASQNGVINDEADIAAPSTGTGTVTAGHFSFVEDFQSRALLDSTQTTARWLQGRVTLARARGVHGTFTYARDVNSSFHSLVHAMRDRSVGAAGTAKVHDLALQDLNGDGYLDVVSAGESGVVVYFNDPVSSSFPTSSTVTTTLFYYLTFGDYDEDGDLDIAAGAWHGQVNVMLYRNNGRGGFDGGTVINPSLPVLRVNDIATADIDSDGHLDLVLPLNGPSGGIDLYSGDGDGGFDWEGQVGSAHPHWDVSVGDLNGDGRPDLVLGKKEESSVFHLNLGDWRFDRAVSFGHVGNSTVLGDVNHDGHLDIVLGVLPPGYNRLYLGDGLGFFGAGTAVGLYRPTSDMELGDLDGDGDLDIFEGMLRERRRQSFAYANRGAGSFRRTGSNFHAAETRAVALGDVDNDGDLDIAFGDQNTTLKIKINPGDTATAAPSDILFDTGRGRVVSGKVNGDVPVPRTVYLTATAKQPVHTDIEYYLSNDGGGHWRRAHPGRSVRFPETGNDLRWRAELKSRSSTLSATLTRIGIRGGVVNRRMALSAPSPVAEGAAVAFNVNLAAGETTSDGAVSAVWMIRGSGDNPVEPGDFDADGHSMAVFPRGTVVIPSGAREAAVTIPILDDIRVETTETYMVVLADATGVELTSTSSHILPSDSNRLLIFSPPPPMAAEGTAISFTVRIDDSVPASDGSVGPTWRIASGGANPASPRDFADAQGNALTAYPSGSVVIPRGAREATVTVPTFDDRKVEITQTFVILLSPPSIDGTILDTPSQSGAIGMSDFDILPIRSLKLPAAPAMVDEGAAMRFTVAIDTHVLSCSVCHQRRIYYYSSRDFSVVAIDENLRPPHGTIAAVWNIRGSGDNPALPSDFADAEGNPLTEYPSGVAVIENSKREVTITVPTVDDDENGGVRTYTVTLSNPGLSAKLIAPLSQSGIINEDDLPPLLHIPTTPTTVAEGTTVTFTVVAGDGEAPAESTASVAWNISSGTGVLTTAIPQDFADAEGNPMTDFPGGIAVIARGSTSAIVTVPTFDDSANEATETYLITLSAPTDATLGATTRTGAISDRADATVVTVVADQSSVDEGATATFTVTLSGGTPTADIEVPFTVSVSDGGLGRANDPPDGLIYGTVRPGNNGGYFMFGATTGTATATFTATTVVIALTITDDDLFEEAETLQVRLGTPRTSVGSVRLGDARSATVTINASDAKAVRSISLSAPSSVDEGSTLSFTISIADDEPVSDGTVSVAWAISGSGQTWRSPHRHLWDAVYEEETEPQDFADAEGNALNAYPVGKATIPAGRRSAVVSVPTYDDMDFDPDETFRITMSSPSGGVLKAPFTRIVRIEDGHSDVLEVPIRRLKVPVAPDAADEGGAIRFTITVTRDHNLRRFCGPYPQACATGSSWLNRGAGGPFKYQSKLSSVLRGAYGYRMPPVGAHRMAPVSDVKAFWKIRGRGANPVSNSDLVGSFGTTIIPADTTSITVTVPVVDDDLMEEAEGYTVYVRWNRWGNENLRAGLEPEYGFQTQNGIINPSDQPLPLLHIPTTPTTVAEGTTLTFIVVLGDGETPADESARVAWNISSGDDALSTVTPQDFADAEGNPMTDFPGGVAVIARGSTSTTVSVATFDDNANEATETYTVTLGDPAGAATIPFPSTLSGAVITPLASTGTSFVISASTRTGIISDRADETIVTIAADRATADEGDTAAFTVSLSGGAHTADVEVPFTVTGDRADYRITEPPAHQAAITTHTSTAATGLLTITTATAAVRIVLSVTDDLLFEGDEPLRITLGTPRTFAGGARLGAASRATVTISASDPPVLNLPATPPTAAEGAAITFTVSIGDSSASPSGGGIGAAWMIAPGGDNPARPQDFADAQGNALTNYPSGAAVIPRGAREVTVTVPTFNDRKVETTQTFVIFISDPTGGAVLGTSGQSGSIGMSDFDRLPIRSLNIPAAPFAVDEGAAIRFTVSIDTHRLSCSVCHQRRVSYSGAMDFSVIIDENLRPPHGTIAASWSIRGSGDNPALPSDFADAEGNPLTEYPSGVAIIENSKRAVTITVPTVDDDEDGGVRTYTVTLSNPGLSAKLIAPLSQGGVIHDNDMLPLNIPSTPTTVAEGTTLTFTVVLGDGETPADETASVVWNISSGTDALRTVTPQDFADAEGNPMNDFPGGVAVIARGSTSTTVSIATFDDSANEATETYTVTLGDPASAPVIPVASTGTGTTAFTLATTGTNTISRTTLATTRTGAISDLADETIVTIAADQSSVDEGTIAAFTVTLSGGTPTADIEVPFTVSVSDGGGGRANDPPDGLIYGTVWPGNGSRYFMIGATTGTATATLTATTGTTTVVIALTIADDDLFEEAETLQVRLGTPRASAGSVRLGNARSAAITINASDPLTVRHISFSAPSRVNEGSPLSFTVRVGDDEPVSDGTVSAAWAISGWGKTKWQWGRLFAPETKPADFAAADGNALSAYPAGTATIPAGERSVVVSVPTYDDRFYDTEEGFRITLSSPSGGVLQGPFSRTGWIADSWGDLDEVPAREMDIPSNPDAVDEGTAIRITVIAASPQFERGRFCGPYPYGCVTHWIGPRWSDLAAEGWLGKPGGDIGSYGSSYSVDRVHDMTDYGITPGANRVPARDVKAYWRIGGSGYNAASPSDFADAEGNPLGDFPRGVVTIPATATSVTITVPTVNDDLLEGAEGYTVRIAYHGRWWWSHELEWEQLANWRNGVSLKNMTWGYYSWSYYGTAITRHGAINPSDLPPPLNIPTTPTTVAEGTTLTFTVVLGDGETPADETASVVWNISSGTDALHTVTPQDFADAEGNPMNDFPGGVAVIARGSTSTTVSVATFDDNANEATETYTVTIGDPASAPTIPLASTRTTVTRDGITTSTFVITHAAIGVTTRTGAISDRADEIVVTIAANQSSVDEGTTATFTVTLSGGTPTADIEVPFTVSVSDGGGGRANDPPDGLIYGTVWPGNGSRYFMVGATTGTATATLTATTGTTTVVIALTIADDDLFEEAETLQVRLGTPRTPAGSVRLGNARSAAITINASDPLTVRHISLGAPSRVNEGSPLSFTVRIGDDEPVSDGTVSVAWAVSGWGKTKWQWGRDFAPETKPADFAAADGNALSAYPAGTATIPAGERSVVVSVPTYDDTVYDTEEGFRITLSSPSGGVLQGPFSRTGWIADSLSDFEEIPARVMDIPSNPDAVDEGTGIHFTITVTANPGIRLLCGPYPYGCVYHGQEVGWSGWLPNFLHLYYNALRYYGSYGSLSNYISTITSGANRVPARDVKAYWQIGGIGNDTAIPSDFADAEGNPLKEYPRGVAIVPANSTSVVVTVPTVNDNLIEGAEGYFVKVILNPWYNSWWTPWRIEWPAWSWWKSWNKLENRRNGAFLVNEYRSRRGTINPSDQPLPPLNIPTTPTTVAEGTTLTFTVVLGDGETPADENARVVWNISSGTDALTTVTPQDFADAEGNPMTDFPGGVAVIERGSTSTTVSVATFDDNANEATETYTVILGDPASATTIPLASTRTTVTRDGITTSTFVITHAAIGVTTRTGAISDLADETIVTIAADQISVNEGTTATFTVTLSGGTPTADIEVPFTVTVSDGSLGRANDPPGGPIYGTVGPGNNSGYFMVGATTGTATATLTATTGTTTVVIALTITDDDLFEESATLQVSLGTPHTPTGSVRLGDARSATIIINASDPLTVRHIGFNAPSRVNEGSPLSFTVSIGDDEPVSDGTVSVAWAVSGWGKVTEIWRRYLSLETEPEDFAAADGSALSTYPAGTATIPAGRRSVVVNVPTYDDAIYDTSEGFRVTLSSPVSGVLEGPFSRTGWVVDGKDDLDEVPAREIDLPSSPDAADEGTAIRITITATANSGVKLFCGPYPFGCTYHGSRGSGSGWTGWLDGRWSIGGTREWFYRSNGITPDVNRVPARDVKAYWRIGASGQNPASPSDFADAEGNALGDFPRGVVTIPATATSVTITVPTVNDDLLEGAEGYTVSISINPREGRWWRDLEQWWVTLENKRNGVFLKGGGPRDLITRHGIINPSDQPLPPLSIPTTPTTVAEGTTLTFTVVLGDGEMPADETARVAWNISSGTDALTTVAPQDFADAEGNPMTDFPGGIAVIARGSTSTTVSVATFDDSAKEVTETYTVIIGDPASVAAIPPASTWTTVTRHGVTTPTVVISHAAIIATRTGAISDRADETVVTIVAEQSRVDEGLTAYFKVSLSGGTPAADVTVPFTVTGDHADGSILMERGYPADVDANWWVTRTADGIHRRTWTVTTATALSTSGAIAGGTLTMSAAIPETRIVLSIEDDNDFELEETLHVRLGTPRTMAGGVRLGDARSASVTIAPSDRNITVGFVPSAATPPDCETMFCARERARRADLCAGIISPPSSVPLGAAQISLGATTAPGSAGTDDYTAVNRRTVVTLDDDNRSRCFSVTLADDASPETAETFNVTLATAQTAAVDDVTVAPGSATVTILDNDIIRVGWAPFSRTATAHEGDGSVTLTAAILSPAADVPIASGDLRLVVNTDDRTAAAPGDFTNLVNHAITLGETARTAAVVIPVLDDDVSEMTTETFSVRLDFAVQDRQAEGNAVLQAGAVIASVFIAPSDPPVPEPMVNAGSDQEAVAESTGTAAVVSATTVTLSGTVARNASDTGSTLSYRWEQVSEDSTSASVVLPGDDDYAGPIIGPTGVTDETLASSGTGAFFATTGTATMSSATAPIATVARFAAPDVPRSKTYYFRLTAAAARAGTSSGTASDIVAVTIDDVEPPRAVASVARGTVMEDTTSTLVGTASDPDGDTDLRYEWTQSPATPPLVIAGTATPVVTWPDVTASGRGKIFTLTLTVTDSQGLVGTDSVIVIVRDDDVTVTIGPASQVVKEGGEAVFTVTLTGGIPTSDIIVPYTVNSIGGGITDDDYMGGNRGSFTIVAGSEGPYTFTIHTRRDNVLESEETLMVTLGTPTAAAPRTVRAHSDGATASASADSDEAGGAGGAGGASGASDAPMKVGNPRQAIVTIEDDSSLRVRLRVFLQGAVIMENEDTP